MGRMVAKTYCECCGTPMMAYQDDPEIYWKYCNICAYHPIELIEAVRRGEIPKDMHEEADCLYSRLKAQGLMGSALISAVVEAMA
jgi:hypothetical protein